MNKRQMLNAIINHYTDGNKKDFASILGVSPQTVSAWVTRNTFDSELLYTKCRELSAKWLLTGEGEMLESEFPKREILNRGSEEEIKILLKENGRLEGKIEVLEHELSEQKKENQRLIDFLRNRHVAGKGFVAVK